MMIYFTHHLNSFAAEMGLNGGVVIFIGLSKWQQMQCMWMDADVLLFVNNPLTKLGVP